MKKTAVFFLLFLLSLFSLFATAYAQPMTLVYDGAAHEYNGSIFALKIDGQQVETDVPPLIIDDRTLVPARAVFEKIGAVVGWEADSRKVTVTLGDTNIELKINDTNAVVNNNIIPLDVPAKIINGRTMIPLRFVGEQLNMEVGWYPDETLLTMDHKNTPIQKAKLENIRYEAADGMENIIISLSAKENFSNFRLPNPDRIVIDIENTDTSASEQQLDVNSPLIKEVRYAKYNDNIARVVMDLSGQPDYRVKSLENQIVLSITSISAGTEISSRGDYDRENDPRQQTGTTNNLSEKLVVIDAGHGGNDPGAVYGDVEEKNLNLDIAKRLNELLASRGIRTIMTREDDTFVNLYDRAGKANDLNADLFLSVHINANDKVTRGTETLYCPSDAADGQFTGESFARIIQDHLVNTLGTVNRKTVSRPNLVVLRETKMPAAIAEIAFLDNKDDRALLLQEEFRQKAASALFEAVIQALGQI